MSWELWFDIKEFFEEAMYFDRFLMIFLYVFNGEIPKIPSVKFWSLLTIVLHMGLKIRMWDNHLLTIEDCFIEINDLLEDSQDINDILEEKL